MTAVVAQAATAVVHGGAIALVAVVAQSPVAGEELKVAAERAPRRGDRGLVELLVERGGPPLDPKLDPHLHRFRQ